MTNLLLNKVGVNILLVVCHTAQLWFVARSSRPGCYGGGGKGEALLRSGVRGRDVLWRGLVVVAVMCGCGWGFIAHRYWLAQGQVLVFFKPMLFLKPMVKPVATHLLTRAPRKKKYEEQIFGGKSAEGEHIACTHI